MKIKTKILWTLLGMSLLVALVGALAVNRQRAAAMVGATKEAENVARVVSFLLRSDSNELSASSAQEIVTKLHQTQGRDVVVVDSNQTVLADAVPSEIGKKFTEDQKNEVGATIKDRQVRTFVEVSQDYPSGIKQIVVPIEGEAGQVMGAVILEYTPLYKELMQLTRSTIRHVVLAGVGSIAIALLIAVYMGRSIVTPLAQLAKVATGFAAGRMDLPMPLPRKDEIGELATAFDNMVQKRQRAEDELRSLHDKLEVRVVERTAELAKANEALQTENTERKRGEESLKDSELRYRSLFENMLDGYAHCRMLCEQDRLHDFVYLDVNNAFETLTGLKNVVGKKVSEVIPGFQAANPELLEIYRRVASTGKPERCETYLKSLGIWFSIAVYSPEKEHFVAVFENITERKGAEKALLESEARNNAIVQSALDCIVMINHEGRILEFNPAAEKVFGYARAEVMGRDLAEVIIPSSLRDQHRQGMKRFLATGEAKVLGKRIEITALRSDGSEFPVELSIAQVGAERPPTFTGFIRDISERKLSEAALEKANKELVAASRQAGKAEVATGVLHNVGNVLNSVNVASLCMADSLKKSKVAYLSKVVVLLREHETDLGVFFTSDLKGRQVPAYLAKLAEQLVVEQGIALKELVQLQKNIEHIKEIVTVQQSCAKGAGKLETLQATDLVEDALRMDSGGQAHRDIQVIREFEAVPAITVDKHKVLQILMNLMRNARQACHEAGVLEKRLTLRVTNGADRVRIAVSDNGVGISPANLARIFAHGFTTKKDGHGFGLHSAGLAAKELGGSLSVHSDGPGQGAAFTLELPCPQRENSDEKQCNIVKTIPAPSNHAKDA